MKKILALLTALFLTAIQVLAQCGYRPPQPQVENRLRSSIAVPDEIKDSKNIQNLATISKKEAKKIATSQYKGRVKHAALEVKDNTLVWKLEVNGESGQKELFIDPQNGNFLGYGLTK